MQFGYVLSRKSGEAGAILRQTAEVLTAQGIALVGAVEHPTATAAQIAADTPADTMEIRLLPMGEIRCISQSLGAGSAGCRLDPDALEAAVMLAKQAYGTGAAQLMLISKFGKLESDGGGFRNLIAEALLADLPVLVAVGIDNYPAFASFADGMATEIACDNAAALAWCNAAITSCPTAARNPLNFI